jgi:hypothetical protein
VGIAQYYGDLNVLNQERTLPTIISESTNPKNYRMSYSLGLNYSFKNYISVGIDWNHFYLAGYDADNVSVKIYDAAFYRYMRNLSFHTTVNQYALHAYYEPYRTEDKWVESKSIISPYLGLGIGVYTFNPMAFYRGKEVELQPLGTEGQGLSGYKSKYSLVDWSIPISVGLKYYFPSRTMSLGLDFTYSFSHTDYIDDVSDRYAAISDIRTAYSTDYATMVSELGNRNIYGLNNPTYGYITQAGEIRGNSQNNDNFMTTQLKLELYLFNIIPKKTCPAYN